MVPGEGPQPCSGLICGEAPGREECKQGRPFVGQSGRLLDTALKSLGIDRSELYLTNVMKVLPLDNAGAIRRPTEDEIDVWLPLLEEEIQNTAPVAILALGRTASQAVTGFEDMIPFGSKIGNVFTAWHPAFVLRNGGMGSSGFEWIKTQLKPWAEAISADR